MLPARAAFASVPAGGIMGLVTHRLAAAALLVLAFGCGGQSPGTSRQAQPSAEFAKVKTAHAEFVAARGTLERAQAEARAGGVDSNVLRQARFRFDSAYARYQKALAAFLSVALNERPANPETREALGLYADAAVANARILLDRGADRRRALEVLEGAERPFRALGLPVPTELATTLEEARRAQGSPPTATPTTGNRASQAPRHRRPVGSRR